MEYIELVREQVLALVDFLLPYLHWLPFAATEIFWILLGFYFAWLHFRGKLRRQLKEFYDGELRGEVIGSVLIFDEEEDGRVLLKPRVVIEARSIVNVFVTHVMQAEVAQAIARCDETTAGSFIILADAEMHEAFMEDVRAYVSPLGKYGHLARSTKKPFEEDIYYVFATFSREGRHRKVRIDLIHEDVLPKLIDDAYFDAITGREEEGSHAELAKICRMVAKSRFGIPSEDADKYSLRVSISQRLEPTT